MDRLEQKICDIIDSRQDEIIAFGRDLWHHAELGFMETRTAEKFNSFLKGLGLEVEEGLAVTGAKAYLNGKGHDGINVALMGELDALPISNHVNANPETGASHCCGHNAQITGVIGAAIALSDPEIKAAMTGGNIVFMSAPAEEALLSVHRERLTAEGKLHYYCGGKCELIRAGVMDDIDITVGHHANMPNTLAFLNIATNAFINKTVIFKGKATHTAGSPQDGIDADSAATLAKVALDMQRESLRDCDTVRIHGYTVKGGSVSNITADEVILDYCIRANNLPALMDASKKFDRAMRAGAIATGSGVTIKTYAGYLPCVPYSAEPIAAVRESLLEVNESVGGKYNISGLDGTRQATSSTDYGDLSHIMPVFQFGTGGFDGIPHNPSFMVTDEYLAYVMCAKIFALIGYKLLKNGGNYAKAVLDAYQAVMTKEEYLAFKDSMNTVENMEMNPIPSLGRPN